MRLSSSTWRSSSSLLVVLLLFAASGSARPGVCLPPVFEGGRRLVFAEVKVGGLNLLLRQHEVCWRRSEHEKRIFLFGNSTIFGYPHPADDTAIEILNRRLEQTGAGAHLFNLGFVLTYNVKDVLILREALRYEPDVIVFSVMLNDFVRVAPLRYPPILKFFSENSREVERFADENPAGVAEPLALWREAQADEARRVAAWRTLRDAGILVRVAVGNWAREVRQRLFPDMPPGLAPIERKRSYTCGDVMRQYAERQTGWQEWNSLAYLEQVRDETGAEILVVSWPAAHDPKGPCFNGRYTTEALEGYRQWIAAETRARGFRFVDLQADFPQGEFVDSVHPTASGQATVARLLEPHLRELLAAPGP
jgi:lysophospholipase L1-like esterase